MKIKKASGILMAMCILAGSASGAVEASNGIDYYLIRDKDKLIHMSIEDYSNNFSNTSSNYYQHFLKDRFLEIEYLVQKQGSEKFSDDKYVYLNDFLKSKTSNNENDSDVMNRVAEKPFGELKDVLYKLSFEGNNPVYKKLEDEEVVGEEVSLKDGHNKLRLSSTGLEIYDVHVYKGEILSVRLASDSLFVPNNNFNLIENTVTNEEDKKYDNISLLKLNGYFNEFNREHRITGPVELESMDITYNSTTETLYAQDSVLERGILKVYIGNKGIESGFYGAKIKQIRGGDGEYLIGESLDKAISPFKQTGLLIAEFEAHVGDRAKYNMDFFIEQIKLEDGQHTFEVYGDHNNHVSLGKEITVVMRNGVVESVVGTPNLGVNNFILKDKNGIQVSKDIAEQVKRILKDNDDEEVNFNILQELVDLLANEKYFVDNFDDASKVKLLEEVEAFYKDDRFDGKYNEVKIVGTRVFKEGTTTLDLSLGKSKHIATLDVKKKSNQEENDKILKELVDLLYKEKYYVNDFDEASKLKLFEEVEAFYRDEKFEGKYNQVEIVDARYFNETTTAIELKLGESKDVANLRVEISRDMKILKEALDIFRHQEPLETPNISEYGKSELLKSMYRMLNDVKFDDVIIEMPDGMSDGETKFNLSLFDTSLTAYLQVSSFNYNTDINVSIHGKKLVEGLWGQGTKESPYGGIIYDIPHNDIEITSENIFIDGDDNGIKFYGVDKTFSKIESFTPIQNGHRNARKIYFELDGIYYEIQVSREEVPRDAIYLSDVSYYLYKDHIADRIDHGEILDESVATASQFAYQDTDIGQTGYSLDFGVSQEGATMIMPMQSGFYGNVRNNEGLWKMSAAYEGANTGTQHGDGTIIFYVH